MQELQKFNSIPGVYRIDDNGTIQVYDVSTAGGSTAPADAPQFDRRTGVGDKRARAAPRLPSRDCMAVEESFDECGTLPSTNIWSSAD